MIERETIEARLFELRNMKKAFIAERVGLEGKLENVSANIHAVSGGIAELESLLVQQRVE